MRYVGIDPAMRLNGLAVCVIDGNKLYFGRYKNLAMWIMDSLNYDKDIAVIVEDSSLQNITFRKHSSNKASNKISRNVGMNQCASRVIIDLLTINGYRVTGISPQAKGSKWPLDYCMAVIKAHQYEIVGKLKLSQDEIDAFTLALYAKNYYNDAGTNY